MKQTPQSPFTGRARLLALLAVILLVVAPLAFLVGRNLWQDRGSDVPGAGTPSAEGPVIRVQSPAGQSASALAGDADSVNPQLQISLSLGQEPPQQIDPAPVASGDPLSEEEIQQILARLPTVTAEPEDIEEFNIPDEPLPPPRTGETIEEAFPPPDEAAPPAVTPEPAAGPLEVLRFAPEGEIPLAPFLQVTFNQPMVPVATIEQLSAEQVPVQLTPQLPGVWRWIGTKTLTFEYQGQAGDRFPMATEYVAEILAGTVSANGAELQETVRWTFRTPPPQLQERYPVDKPQPLEPLIFLSFDQHIEPEAVLESVRLMAGSGDVALRLATSEEIENDEEISRRVERSNDGYWLVFRPQEPLPQDTNITVTVGPGTPSAEGPLTSPEAESFSFHTYAPLRVEEHRCGWFDGECPPFAPFYIHFNNPLDTETFDQSMISIEPELPGAIVDVMGSSIEIRGATEGRTTYRVTLNGELRDIFGQTLGSDETLTFRVGSARPILLGPNQSLVTLEPAAASPTLSVHTVNYNRLEVQAYAVSPEQWPDFQEYMRNYSRSDNAPSPPGQRVLNKTIRIEAAADALTEVGIDLSEALEGEHGHLIVVVQPPSNLISSIRGQRRPVIQTWVQVTNIGLDAFADHSNLVAWATALEDGAPLAGVELSLHPASVTATTGPDGTATLELSSSPAALLIGRLEDDSAILPRSDSYWNDGGWERRPLQDQLRWYVFDDRKMYRPGEEVHVKGWLRHVGAGQSGDVMLPSGISTVRYEVYDPQGNELSTGSAEVNALGGFDLSFDIPENSNLGYAGIRLNTNGGEYYHEFQIQEFRRPEFEVTARNESEGPFFVGDSATVSLAANYYAGGPLPNADVTWNVFSSPAHYSPPNWPDFIFGEWTPWWYFEPVPYGDIGYYPWDPGYPIQSTEVFTGFTDAAGRHFLQIDFEAINKIQPFTVQAEGSVMDVNRQAWAGSTRMLVHPAEHYVGLRSERTFVERGQPLEIQAIVTDLDGNAITGSTIQMEAARLEWRYTAGSWGEETAEVQECTVTSAAEPVSCSFETDQGGRYQITATITDGQGRSNQSRLTRWVSGGQRPAAREVEQEQATLIPDKETYEPGDVAQILVQAPFSPAEGLLTVSRSGILYTESFAISEGSYTLQVPIEEGHVPNLNVQVDLVGQAQRTDDAGNPLPDAPPRPAFATGSLTLNISLRSRTLDVAVAPRENELEPGGETTVEVTVTDASGAPVSGAEVAVVVVDEAILALSNYQLADPLNAFYYQRSLDVQSTYGRASVVLASPESLLEQGADEMMAMATRTQTAADGAVAEEAAEMEMPAAAPAADLDSATANAAQESSPIRVRTDFNPLATFAPAAHTDEQGRAEVAVQLPDNLTRYRIMAVAVAGDRHFGSGESSLTARLPLMVRPAAPRFLNFGDRFELPVVLQNQTDEPMTVDVVVQGGNLTLSEGAGQRVTIPANDRVEVRFPAAAESAGTARLQFAAVAAPGTGAYADAATVELPVYTPATTEAFATYGVIDQGAIAQPIAAPEGVFPQFGGLEISTSSTALQALTDAVLYLSSYPYEYPEPIASRILAIAALRDVLGAFDAEGLPEPAELEAAVQRDIETLQGLQNSDGGFAIWRRGEKSVPFYSIHVAHALQRAQDKGFAVPSAMMQSSLDHLRNIEHYYPEWYGERIRHSLSAYALYVRHLMGDSDRAKASNLLNEAGLEELSLEAVAWIWQVLGNDPAYAAQTEAIARHISNRAVETASAANFTTSYGDEAYLMLHSNRRTDGVILDALIANQPQSDLIPKVVNGLLANRTRGRWENTQENVFILLALDRYFNTFEAQTPQFVARIWLGETYAGSHEFEGRTTDTRETNVPMSYLVEQDGEQPLVLSKEGEGRLYYRLGLRYAPDDLELDPLDMGFVVERTYEGVDDPDDVWRDEEGNWHIRAGARVRVRLTMVSSNRRYHVALVDPLPAGLEIVNPSLAVSASAPENPAEQERNYGWWWWGTWYEHQNMRDERAEAFTTLLWEGVYDYTYVTRATTPGAFVVPPAKAEEMYTPEVFGRSSSDLVIIE